ncbi:MAG: 50S ribosomal protein L3 [Candidatus Omnitrophica bacterium]|nr:50S ribosomal protein L3 [Candidatus Omnitrophota bacterium]
MLKEIFAKKLGMTQIFDNEGNLIPVTAIEIEPVFIIEKKEYPGKGVFAKIGCFKVPENKTDKISKPLAGYFKKNEVAFYKLVREVMAEKEIELKKEIGIEIFNEGDIVDVRGRTKGRGFAGGIKRHNWHGGPSSHGSMSHRRIGSNGSNTDPGRVLRGHRMPGHYGNQYRTIKNLKIVKIDKDKGLLFIKGALPGHRGSLLSIKKVS